MKNWVFVHIEESVPEIYNHISTEFLLNYQRSMLLALVEKELLSTSQMERCMEEIYRHHAKEPTTLQKRCASENCTVDKNERMVFDTSHV